MNNEIKINVPEGMEIDKENSTLECIKFKPKKKELPKTWEEFRKNNPVKPNECYISTNSDITEVQFAKTLEERIVDIDDNLLPSKEYAEAMLALCKIIQLRDCYNDGWKADWKNDERKYVIFVNNDRLNIWFSTKVNYVLSFKTEELRDKFFCNFRDLIEQAKLLL